MTPVLDNGGSTIEHEAADGRYACPGCGQRYDTPGVCEGSSEGPHEPITVDDVHPPKAKPAPKAKPTASAKASVPKGGAAAAGSGK